MCDCVFCECFWRKRLHIRILAIVCFQFRWPHPPSEEGWWGKPFIRFVFRTRARVRIFFLMENGTGVPQPDKRNKTIAESGGSATPKMGFTSQGFPPPRWLASTKLGN